MTVDAAPPWLLPSARQVDDAETWGRVALLTAIFSILSLGVLGPLALTFGLVARRAMRRAGVTSQGHATAAIVIGGVAVGTAVTAVALVVALGLLSFAVVVVGFANLLY
ncbi:MAG: DUF4190 domain-containing protein [Cellulomonas sp.]